MKKLLRLLPCLLGVCLAACVDQAYDLEKIDTDGIAIGDKDSEFRFPVATIHIKTREIVTGNDTSEDISVLLDDTNVWLPEALPGGSDWIDIARLKEDSYVDALFDALYLEMADPASGKLEEVADLVWRRCRHDFTALLHLDDFATEEAFKEAFRQLYTQSEVRTEARRQAGFYFDGLNDIQTMHYDLGRIDIDDTVVDMLSENLDPEGTPDPVNTLSLYGSIACHLPLNLDLDASLTSTSVRFACPIDADRGSNPIDEVRIYAEDLRRIVDGTSISMPVSLLRYYPKRELRKDPDAEQFVITLSLVKRGPLKFDL